MSKIPPEVIDACLVILGYLARWIVGKFHKDQKMDQLKKENIILHSYLIKKDEQKRES